MFLQVGALRLEAIACGPPPARASTLVFLHEGLGCAAQWRDLPAQLAQATGCGALAYSRAGYGASDSVPLPRPLDYMQREGVDVLPGVLAAAGVRDAILVGHSDGASIAIAHAGGTPALNVRALVLLAPHVFCEDISVRSIAAARADYLSGDLRARLERWHGKNTECAFWGWNQAWLDPGFRDWNIEAYLPRLRVPVLAIQGEDDEYGTRAQVEAIRRQAGAGAEVLLLPECGHAPQRDQPAATQAAIAAFIERLRARG
ncbi:MAG TPA: alpha/beta hydrolase [Polyangia bacterium]|nr:alpha/beta hydrolase [Polyangia bacterium]